MVKVVDKSGVRDRHGWPDIHGVGHTFPQVIHKVLYKTEIRVIHRVMHRVIHRRG
jgi:hypothetical protein